MTPRGPILTPRGWKRDFQPEEIARHLHALCACGGQVVVLRLTYGQRLPVCDECKMVFLDNDLQPWVDGGRQFNASLGGSLETHDHQQDPDVQPLPRRA